MWRYGIFGGGFNPPHLAHVMTAAYAIAQRNLEILYVSPCGHHAFAKNDKLIPWEHRAEMCRRAFEGFGGTVRIPKWEEKGDYTYTVDLLRDVARHGEPHLIIGSDNWDLRHQWKGWDEILDILGGEERILVVPRPDTKMAEQLGWAMPDVSSTRLRELIAAGNTDEVLKWVPPSVVAYIRHHGLYGHTTR
jgi:nicotinate-nucleotide adenylyltransferase